MAYYISQILLINDGPPELGKGSTVIASLGPVVHQGKNLSVKPCCS